MVEPLNFCTSNALQKFNPIGIGYLGNRKVCLFGGAAILICALFIIAAPSFLYSTEKISEKSKSTASQIEKAQKKFKSRIANGKVFSEQTLLNETLILKFLTHPKARDLILEGRKKLQNFALAIYPEVQRFGESHPDYLEVQDFVEKFAIYTQPLPYEQIFVPFLSIGALDTSGINDPTMIKAIQTFQVRIFKYWLGLYKIGKKDKQLFNDLLVFCRTSSLDIFSKLIGPLLSSLFEKDDKESKDHYDEVICFFINAEWADYQKESRYDANPLIDLETSQKISKEIAQHFAELESKKTPGEKLVEDFRAELVLKYPMGQMIIDEVTRDYLSRDAIIALFLELTEN